MGVSLFGGTRSCGVKEKPKGTNSLVGALQQVILIMFIPEGGGFRFPFNLQKVGPRERFFHVVLNAFEGWNTNVFHFAMHKNSPLKCATELTCFITLKAKPTRGSTLIWGVPLVRVSMMYTDAIKKEASRDVLPLRSRLTNLRSYTTILVDDTPLVKSRSVVLLRIHGRGGFEANWTCFFCFLGGPPCVCKPTCRAGRLDLRPRVGKLGATCELRLSPGNQPHVLNHSDLPRVNLRICVCALFFEGTFFG